MGFHIVFTTEDGLDSIYLDKPEDIFDITDKLITKDSLIYEAAVGWKPKFIKDHEKFKDYFSYMSRMGKLGEIKFENFMQNTGYPVDRLRQDKEQHDKYVALNQGENIKSPDYIIQGLDIYAEVKAQSINNSFGKLYCCINNYELEKLSNWQKFHNKKVYLFVFEIKKREEVQDTPYIISIDEIIRLIKLNKIKLGHHYCYQIPIEFCFNSIEEIKTKENKE